MAETVKFAVYSETAIAGKSSFGRVANEKFDRPACTVNRPDVPSSAKVTKAPSGNFLTISCKVTAETVLVPALSTMPVTRSKISISRSVARKDT